jgi:hypothetical protein
MEGRLAGRLSRLGPGGLVDDGCLVWLSLEHGLVLEIVEYECAQVLLISVDACYTPVPSSSPS